MTARLDLEGRVADTVLRERDASRAIAPLHDARRGGSRMRSIARSLTVAPLDPISGGVSLARRQGEHCGAAEEQ